MNFLQGSFDSFSEACSSMQYVVPNLHSLIQPIPASSLKLTTLDEWPESNPLISKVGHFLAVHLHKIANFPIDKKTLVRQYEKMVERMHMDSLYAEMVHIEVLTCIRDMCKNNSVLCGKAINEAEVRFTLGTLL